jgi:dihydrofolate reductase
MHSGWKPGRYDLQRSTDMGRVVLQLGISIDGFVVYPPAEEHEEMVKWKVRSVSEAAVHVMGRVTYEGMAGHWPTSSSPFAAPMNDIPKVVFSSTIQRADWPESRIARGPLAQEIATLKDEVEDGVVLAHGGPSFARALTGAGLVDEYRVVLWPVIAGDQDGDRWFGDLAKPQALQLVEAVDFPDGSAARVYRPA